MEKELTKKQYRNMLMKEINQLREAFENFIMSQAIGVKRRTLQEIKVRDQIHRLDFAIEFENPNYPDGEAILF